MRSKLMAILSADIVSFSSLMERNVAGTLARVKTNVAKIVRPKVKKHGGRVFKSMGDAVLAEFPSALAAVKCALDIQSATAASEETQPDQDRLRYRIGINLADVIPDGDDILGDGVNIAARIQSLAAEGCIAVSSSVAEQVSGKIGATLEDLGVFKVKNIARPVHVFGISGGHSHTAEAARPAPAANTERFVSICVLPFVNMSADAEQDYFSSGITEDIITDLSKISSLSVVSRNTAFSFKAKGLQVSQVARQLNVTHVLEGSVRKQNQRVRITAQLIDGKTDGHVWAERWDRELDDIFALQEEIASAVAAALRLKLLREERLAIAQRDTQNVEAYETYLMARQYYVASNMTDARKSEVVIRLCKRAIELDPTFARAWATLAIAQRLAAYAGRNADYEGKAAAERALALNDKLTEAHAAKIGVMISAHAYDAAREALVGALTLDPNSYELNKEAARLAFQENRYQDAIKHFEKAALQDSDYSSLGMLMTCYDAIGDKKGERLAAERTLARVEPIVAREPDNGSALSFGLGALAILGQADRAKEWARRALLLDPDNLNMRYNIACAFIANLKEFETGLDILEPVMKGFSKARLDYAKSDPDLAAVREHP
ncbi:MAG TPA: adenylate/guanylate cyclase domain-containing protein, partial [Alphaproteobacteria bacterium]|nr:adenylate/guanylate cyclase domain-containing protein [Alphaproteobacteria bacterium]